MHFILIQACTGMIHVNECNGAVNAYIERAMRNIDPNFRKQSLEPDLCFQHLYWGRANAYLRENISDP